MLFEEFLKSEFSEENIQFWRACERHKGLPQKALKKEAEAIFEEYISQQASKLVSNFRMHVSASQNYADNVVSQAPMGITAGYTKYFMG